MLGALIGAGSSLLGGWLNSQSADKANAANLAMAERNIDLQKQFAKSGIRWKVEDAKHAGIHPLYALGAQTTSFSPVSAGAVADTSLGSGLASAGQDISRAMNATRTSSERDAAFTKTLQDLQLTKFGLENELLASQIQKLKSNTNPPFPSIDPLQSPIPEGSPEKRPPLLVGGKQWFTDPSTTNQEDFAKRYGDDGPISWLTSAIVAWEDYKRNSFGSNPQGPAGPPSYLRELFYPGRR